MISPILRRHTGSTHHQHRPGGHRRTGRPAGRHRGLWTSMLLVGGLAGLFGPAARPAAGTPQDVGDAPQDVTAMAASPFRLPTDLPMRLIPAYRTLDVLLIQKFIPLDAEQLRIVKAAFEAYERSYRAELTDVRAAMTDVQSRAIDLLRAWLLQDQLRRDLEALDVAYAEAGDTSITAQKITARQKDKLRQETATLIERLVGMEFTEKSWDNERDRLDTLLTSWATSQAVRAAALESTVLDALTAEQLDLWPTALRAIHRDRWLVNGRLAGESLNLERMLDRLELEAPALQVELAAAMAGYHERLDASMAERERIVLSVSDEVWKSSWTPAEARAAAKRVYAARRQVADETLAMAARIEAELEPEAAVSWRTSVRESVFPSIYRRTMSERVLRAALELSDLGADTALAIESILMVWEEELSLINSSLEDRLREREGELSIGTLLRQWGFEAGEGMEVASTEVHELMKQRSVRGMTYVARLRALLTPEQAVRLPMGGP